MAKLDGSERVLAVPGGVADAIFGRSEGFLAAPHLVGLTLRTLLGLARFISRTDALEQDPSWRQLIPYGYLFHAGRVFAYRRARAGAEERLHAKASIGIGGHVNPGDAIAGLLGSTTAETLANALGREMTEELGPVERSGVEVVGFLIDKGDAVGRVHLGVVFRCDVLGPRVEPADDIEPLGWHEPAQLARLDVEWEGWSRLLLDQVGARSPLPLPG